MDHQIISKLRKTANPFLGQRIVVIEGSIFFKEIKSKKGLFIDRIKRNNFLLENISLTICSIEEQPDDHNCIVINTKSSSKRLVNSNLLQDSKFTSRFDFDEFVKSSERQPYLSIWYDDTTAEISISRHVLGVIPLYYVYIPSQLFAFSTEIHSLININGLVDKVSINESWVSNYLISNDSNYYNPDTAYSNIKRLLPGHNILVNQAGSNFKQTPYFTFKPEKWSNLQSAGEYGEAFKSLFAKSIERGVIDNKPIIAQLSGGLDSSSISCMVRALYPDQPIHTLFLDLQKIVQSEKHLALEVAEKIQSEHHVIPPSEHDLDALILHTSLYGYPEHMISGSAITHTLLKKASELGGNTMFNGHDGDGIVGIGIEYPEILYDQFKWTELAEILSIAACVYPYYHIDKQWNTFSVKKKKEVYLNHFLYRQLQRKMNQLSIPDFITHVYKVHDFFGISSSVALFLKIASVASKKLRNGKVYPNTVLNKELSQNLKIDSYAIDLPKTMSRGLHGVDNVSFQDIYGGESLSAAEHLYALRKHYGVIEKFPFFDHNLFELTMSVPLEIKYSQGRRRGYLREAMKGILPESIRSRGDKGKFSLYGRDAAIRLYKQSSDFLTPQSQVWNFVDLKKFNSFVTLLHREKQPGRATSPVLRVISLAVWLDWIKNKNF